MNLTLRKCITTSAVLGSLCLAPHSYASAVNIQWLGGPTMLIKFGSISLLTDPMLGEGEAAYRMGDPNEAFDLAKGPRVKDHKRLTALPALKLAQLDAVVISHSHEDHFDQAARTLLSGKRPVIVPPADNSLVKGLGFTAPQPLAWGQQWRYQEGEYQVVITALPAYHSASAQVAPLLGEGNGYWFEFIQGDARTSLYWMGDTFLTEPLKEWLAARPAPDILVPHVGRVGTTGPLGQISMGAAEVIEAIQFVQPAYTLPIHHSTYELYLEPISTLLTSAEVSGVSVDLPAVGSWMHYPQTSQLAGRQR